MQKVEDQVKRNTVRGFFMTLYVTLPSNTSLTLRFMQ